MVFGRKIFRSLPWPLLLVDESLCIFGDSLMEREPKTSFVRPLSKLTTISDSLGAYPLNEFNKRSFNKDSLSLLNIMRFKILYVLNYACV